jgi:hypothetical protein
VFCQLVASATRPQEFGFGFGDDDLLSMHFSAKGYVSLDDRTAASTEPAASVPPMFVHRGTLALTAFQTAADFSASLEPMESRAIKPAANEGGETTPLIANMEAGDATEPSDTNLVDGGAIEPSTSTNVEVGGATEPFANSMEDGDTTEPPATAAEDGGAAALRTARWGFKVLRCDGADVAQVTSQFARVWAGDINFRYWLCGCGADACVLLMHVCAGERNLLAHSW